MIVVTDCLFTDSGSDGVRRRFFKPIFEEMELDDPFSEWLFAKDTREHSRTIRVDGLNSKVTTASFLANGEKVALTQDGDTLTVPLPAKALNPYDTVVKVSL